MCLVESRPIKAASTSLGTVGLSLSCSSWCPPTCVEKTREPSASKPVGSEREHSVPHSLPSCCLHCLLLQQSLVLIDSCFPFSDQVAPSLYLIYSFLSMQLPPCLASYSVPAFSLPYFHLVLLGHKPISLKYYTPWCSGYDVGYDVHSLLGFPERSPVPQWETQPD